jgi:hypothetical protein
MKATLVFTLPEEADNHRAALEGHLWREVVLELDRELRSIAKHGEEPAAYRAEWARELLYRILDESGVELP